MSDGFTIDVPDDFGATVISIEVLRKARLRYPKPQGKDACEHMRIALDRAQAMLKCRDCEALLNPVEWIARAAFHWGEVRRMYDAARHESRRLDFRRRVVCRCGETIHLRGRPEDEKRRKEEREGRYEEALERIAGLVPEAAAKYAGEIARTALAARASAAATNGPASLPRTEAPPSPLVPAPRSTNGDDR